MDFGRANTAHQRVTDATFCVDRTRAPFDKKGLMIQSSGLFIYFASFASFIRLSRRSQLTTEIVIKQLVQEALQMVRTSGMTQFTQRFCLDLPNPFPRDIKLLTHLFKRVISVHVDAESHSQYLGFPSG